MTIAIVAALAVGFAAWCWRSVRFEEQRVRRIIANDRMLERRAATERVGDDDINARVSLCVAARLEEHRDQLRALEQDIRDARSRAALR